MQELFLQCEHYKEKKGKNQYKHRQAGAGLNGEGAGLVTGGRSFEVIILSFSRSFFVLSDVFDSERPQILQSSDL